jgi:hypothetical protein
MGMNWILAAKAKIFKDRLMAWGVLINFIMLACLSLGIKLVFWQLAILGTLALIMTYIDMKYIIPMEQAYYFQRNPEWRNR